MKIYIELIKECLNLEKLNVLGSDKIKYIHFIGIDGISMSGLAEILINLGYKISGSDLKTSNRTEKLEKMGAKIYPCHREENIDNPDLVVYTAAIKNNNPEISKSKKLNIPMIDRATLLGEIMKKYPYSVAVSGTHGKTTTTSMITMIMLESGLDPTIHIGAELEPIGGTTKIGNSRYFVAEACEYYGSFLKFHPYLAVILNIEYDHADYFKDIEHIKETFLEFASLIPTEGYLVACTDDSNVSSLLDKVSCNLITYGLKSGNAMWTAKDITFDDLGCASFTAVKEGQIITSIKLHVPGIHNVSNALAAIAACDALGCSSSSIKQGLNSFVNARKRFELKGTVNNIKVIDDYAHHPSEIKATLKAAKNTLYSKIWCVFQPHTYTRTKFLLNEFATSFADADTIIITDIYAAREQDTGEVNSAMLADKIAENGGNVVYIPEFEAIAEYLKRNASPGDLIITMGAGNICKVGEMFLENNEVMAVS